MNAPKTDMNYSEVFKQMKQLTDQKTPVNPSASPSNFNNATAPKRMDYKGKK